MNIGVEITYLRSRARRIREIAIFESVIASELLRMADDLDGHANQLETDKFVEKRRPVESGRDGATDSA